MRGRMPTLEIINERFARLLRLGLFNFMRRSANVTAGPVRVIKFSEFVRHLAVPSNLNLVHVKPLRGTSLFVFDPILVFLVVDNLFGGDGRFFPRKKGGISPRQSNVLFSACSIWYSTVMGSRGSPYTPSSLNIYGPRQTPSSPTSRHPMRWWLPLPSRSISARSWEKCIFVSHTLFLSRSGICFPAACKVRHWKWTNGGLAASQSRCNRPR